MNFVDRDGTTEVYIPVHPCRPWLREYSKFPKFSLSFGMDDMRINSVFSALRVSLSFLIVFSNSVISSLSRV